MIKKEISDFDIGDTVKCMSGEYEILNCNFILVKGKKIHISSNCKNLETGKEIEITCRNNRNFVKV